MTCHCLRGELYRAGHGLRGGDIGLEPADLVGACFVFGLDLRRVVQLGQELGASPLLGAEAGELALERIDGHLAGVLRILAGELYDAGGDVGDDVGRQDVFENVPEDGALDELARLANGDGADGVAAFCVVAAPVRLSVLSPLLAVADGDGPAARGTARDA